MDGDSEWGGFKTFVIGMFLIIVISLIIVVVFK